MSQFVLLSHERSGSHFVGEFVSGLQGMHIYDEVCNPHAVQAQDRPESYYGFLHRYIQAHPELLQQMSFGTHSAWLRAYFGFLAEHAGTPHSLVDIKYGHIHKFEQHWWQALSRPMLMSFCEYEGIGIVHLYRVNVVQAVASYMVAEQRQVWHSWQEGAKPVGKPKVQLDCERLVAEAQLLVQQQLLTKRWLRNTRHFTLTYEDAAAQLPSGGQLADELCAFIGSARSAPFVASHERVSQSLAQTVSNYDELKAVCELAGLGRHVEA